MALKDYTKEFPKNLHIAVPIMVGQIAHLLVALADNIMVGELGAAQLAAVSLGNTLIFIALSVGIGFSFAITPLVAEADAQGDSDKVTSIFHLGFLMSFIMGVLLMLLMFLSEPILYMLDQPKEVVDLAIPYMRWVALSLIPLMMFQAVKQFIDGLSKTTYSMIASIVANIINVLLNYVFIYGKFGFPRLEVEGAAIGTFVARILMFLILTVLLFFNKQFKSYFYLLKNYSFGVINKLFHLGLPTALQMLFEVSLFTAAIFLSGTLGTNSQAANQIALNLSALTFMVGVGLGVTATIRVGNQKGLGHFSDLKRIARSLFLLTFIFELVFAFCFLFFRNQLPFIYIDNIDVVELASKILIIAAFFQLSDGFQVVLLGALRGFQDVWIPTLICFIAYWIVGFPISFILSSYYDFGVQGIWMGLLVALSLSAVLMFLRYRYLLSSYDVTAEEKAA
ncbi:MATE family efflux transporter [Nonlabens sp. MB-3u-79]|uniref:MATE family efflux transporter n=1 Tax=Nonlabens sp. MB-3u-79 TaxID=2058134 RepID=UPI000C319011|nr:MATE family efflux transporter [Nonlabens sp. MB-3u-79]AUC79496.1 MATE family efflux transporter [Nonlabens sp. MB-3u-79]|tara:strand:+ start:4758 stop:6113 length:1356 start_codon:yes stop_codon:yes gene_type:complete